MAQASKSDLVGASAERLQPLPTGNLEGWSDETEREWLEVMTEKADRGEKTKPWSLERESIYFSNCVQ